MSTLYDVLQVPRDADAGLIKAAWRSQAKTTHPDVGGRAEAFARLEEAYRTLADPALRAAYDRQIERTAPSASAAPEDNFTLIEDETLDGVFVTDIQAPSRDHADPWVPTPPPWAPGGSRERRPRGKPSVRLDGVMAVGLAVGFLGAVALLAWAALLQTGWAPPPAAPFVVTRGLYDSSLVLFDAAEIAAVLTTLTIVLHGTVAVRWLRRAHLSRLLFGTTVASGVACTLWLIVPLAIVILSLILWFFAGMAALWVFGSVIGATAGGSGAG